MVYANKLALVILSLLGRSRSWATHISLSISHCTISIYPLIEQLSAIGRFVEASLLLKPFQSISINSSSLSPCAVSVAAGRIQFDVWWLCYLKLYHRAQSFCASVLCMVRYFIELTLSISLTSIDILKFSFAYKYTYLSASKSLETDGVLFFSWWFTEKAFHKLAASCHLIDVCEVRTLETCKKWH